MSSVDSGMRDEVLGHLSDIKSVLDDKRFFPYDYNALIVWGIVSILLSIFLLPILKSSLMLGMVFLFAMLILAFAIEGLLIKKENVSYDIERCTDKQKFIASCYMLASLFGVVMTLLLAKHELLVPIYMIWIFICGLGNFIVGYTINMSLFTKSGYVSITISVILLAISFGIDDLYNIESIFARVAQFMTILLLGVVPIWQALIIKKECSVV